MKPNGGVFIFGAALQICSIVAAAGHVVEPDALYQPPVPLQEARPVVPGPGGSECCAVTEEAAKTQVRKSNSGSHITVLIRMRQGEAERELGTPASLTRLFFPFAPFWLRYSEDS